MENKHSKKQRSEDKTLSKINVKCDGLDIENQKRKHKSPSKQIRDLRRLLMFKCRVKNTIKVSQSTQTDTTGNEERKKTSKWLLWRRKPNNKDAKQPKHIAKTPPTRRASEVKSCHISVQRNELEDRKEDKAQERNHFQEINPVNIYKNLDHALQLSYLEEPSILTMALRHLVRHKHEKGETVTFPQIEAVDRIVLRSKNLPTDPNDLLELVKRVFKRREENFDVGEVYSQFVKAHGRTSFDPRQSWPQCYIHTYNP